MIKRGLLSVVALGAALLGGAMAVPTYAAEVTVEDEEALKTCLTTTDNVCVMAKDVELTKGIDIADDVKVTLDLNGYTVSYNPADKTTSYAISNSGNLTIMDGSAGGAGKITNNAANPDTATIPGYASNTIRNNGDLVINSGAVVNTTAAGGATYAVDTFYYDKTYTPSLTINGGKLSSNSAAVRLMLYADNAKEAAFNLAINGGEIVGSRGIWIQLPGGTDAGTKYANVNINGGTITRTSTNDLALYSYSFGEAYSGVVINIAGGTFNGDVAVGGGSVNNGTGFETLNVTGGTFNGEVYTYNSAGHNIAISDGEYEIAPEAEYIKAGYKVTDGKNDAGHYGIILNLPSASDEVHDENTSENNANEEALAGIGAGMMKEVVEKFDELIDGGEHELEDGTKFTIASAEGLKEAIANGDALRLALMAMEFEKEDLYDEEIEALESVLLPTGATKLEKFFGAFVELLVEERSLAIVSELPETLKLVFAGVEADAPVADGYERVWGMIRIHDGVAQVIPAEYNETTKELTAESDKYSLFVPYYVDTKKVIVPGAPNTGMFDGEKTSAKQDIVMAALFSSTIAIVVMLGVAMKVTKR